MWQANREYLEYLVKLLTAASTVRDASQQREIAKSMEDFCALPEADLYMLIVLTSPPDTGMNETIRSMAGLVLKNNVRRRDTFPLETVAFMQQCNVLGLLHDGTTLVRGTLGTLLAGVALRLGRQLTTAWPDLLPTLLQTAGQGDANAARAAAEALAKICEDVADELATDVNIGRIIGGMLRLLQREETKQAGLLKAVNCFILQDDVIEGALLQELLTVLSHRATVDTEPTMRRIICQSLNLLLEAHGDGLGPTLPSIMEFMLKCVEKGANEDAVALEAAEFWLALAERDSTETLQEMLLGIMPRLLPVLLANTIYADDDPELEANRETTAQMEQLNNVRPRHHNAVLRGEKKKENEKGESGNGNDQENEEGEIDSNEEEDDEDEDEMYGAWTLRKCSAATIDVLATTMDEAPFLAILLPLISANLMSTDWKAQEAGILALGAVAEGCSAAMDQHIVQLTPFLLQCLQSTVPIVRAISAWTLSRYAGHLAVPAVLTALVQLMGDSNKRVQHAACTAVSVFAEKQCALTGSILPLIMQTAHKVLSFYPNRNVAVLYDMVGTIADRIDCLDHADLEAFSLILPLLMQRWVDTDENDPSLFALLECICSISVGVGALMAPFASVILQRCVAMAETTLKAVVLVASPDTEIDFDFCIVALDLIGALVQGLGPALCPLLSTVRLDTILQRCCTEPRPQMRQAAFALVGDLAEKCSEVLKPEFVLDTLIPAIAAHMDPLRDTATHGSANNAVWALGELVQCGRFPQIAPVVINLGDSLCQLLTYTNVHTSYLENVAVCLGRCLIIAPPPMALGAVLPRWAQMIALDTDIDECQSAWLPMVAMLHRHSDLLTPEAVPALFSSINCTRGSPQLEAAFLSLVVLMKNRIGDGWSEYCRTIPLDIVTRFNLN
ncbi:hypothetical protein PSACC_03332 [Paramicrosporidium saccamoebae]|uniref:Uncharacterized protein n=1 Tax=Paramicrosporidium saccamoebae TaxID=1246581 RepID=A0A2H9TGF8_9FUNG|nr:hypothetical protein PSACC_03332 [Paramicrosporidium saccamoebae]